MKKYTYQLTSNEMSLIMALLKIEVGRQTEWAKSCEECGDDECQRVAEKNMAEMQAIYDNLQEQHFSRFERRTNDE